MDTDDDDITRALLMSLNLQDSSITSDVIKTLIEGENVSWIVRREDGSKFDSMTRYLHDGLLTLFSDDTRGIYECVLQRPPQLADVYSLFRLENDSVAEVGYHYLRIYLSPFFDHLQQQRSLSTSVLQNLVDLAKNSQEISSAHVAVLTECYEALSDPEVKLHVNSHKYPGKKTPLILAVENVSIEGVIQLTSCGASVTNTDENGDTIFHQAARIPVFGAQVINAIQMRREVLDMRNNGGEYALLLACRHGNYEVALKMVQAGAKVDICDDVGYPIHYALTRNNIETVLAILERHPNHGKVKCAKYGGTLLHWAKSIEFIDIVIALKDHEIDARSRTGDTALSVMVQRNRPMCAFALMRAGADVNIPDKDGNTPLHHAVRKRDLLTICRLIMANADVNKFNNVGESPRHLAANDTDKPGGRSDVVIVLQEVSAKRCPPGSVGCKEGCVDGEQDETTDKSYWKYYTMYHRDEMGMEAASLQSMANFQESYFATAMSGDFQELSSCSKDTMKNQPLRVGNRDSKDTVLCLDGGGIRGLVILQLLDEIEQTSGKRITELFDWIVGTSTGGIIAIALSHGYTVSECRHLYLTFKDEIFVGSSPYNVEILEKHLKKFFGEDISMDKHVHPKVLVSSTLGDRTPPALHFFRNFEPPDTSTSWNRANNPLFDPLPRPSDQFAWEAARASCAAPTYFAPYGRYLDGGLIANNPTLDALTEIHEYYDYNRSQGGPEREIGVVVSLGTGFTQPKRITHVKWRNPLDILRDAVTLNIVQCKEGVEAVINLKDILVDQVTESRMRAVDRAEAWCRSIKVPFYRFSPPLSQEVKLDETSDNLLRRMENDTMMYIQRNIDQFENLSSLIDSLSEQRASRW